MNPEENQPQALEIQQTALQGDVSPRVPYYKTKKGLLGIAAAIVLLLISGGIILAMRDSDGPFTPSVEIIKTYCDGTKPVIILDIKQDSVWAPQTLGFELYKNQQLIRTADSGLRYYFDKNVSRNTTYTYSAKALGVPPRPDSDISAGTSIAPPDCGPYPDKSRDFDQRCNTNAECKTDVCANQSLASSSASLATTSASFTPLKQQDSNPPLTKQFQFFQKAFADSDAPAPTLEKVEAYCDGLKPIVALAWSQYPGNVSNPWDDFRIFRDGQVIQDLVGAANRLYFDSAQYNDASTPPLKMNTKYTYSVAGVGFEPDKAQGEVSNTISVTTPNCQVCIPTPPITCNTTCSKDSDCAGAKDGCSVCVGASTASNSAQLGTCQKSSACNSVCSKDSDCTGATDGTKTCYACIDGACKVPPACNSACSKNADCVGAKDGCTACTGGTCKTPACGTACSKDSDCAGAKDTCTTCVAGNCQNFSSDMCECDGMDISAGGTGQEVEVTAFGKVVGANIPKAQIQDFKFTVTKESTIIFQSPKVVPAVVESSVSLVKYRAKWKFTVPADLDPNATYRIFNSATCKPKTATASAAVGAQSQLPLTQQAPVESVLGTSNSFLDSLWDTIVALLSGTTAPAAPGPVGTNPTPTPIVAPGRQSVQLRTFTPFHVIQKSCRFILFRLASKS